MSIRSGVLTLALCAPFVAEGQDTTAARRDSIRRADSLRRVQQDTTRRDPTRRDTTMRRDTTNMLRSIRPDTTARAAVRQDTARRVVASEQRIPVQKDFESRAMTRTGTRAQMRADSIARMEQMRQDSVNNAARMRQDSIDAVARRTADSLAAIERARTDSLAAIEKARTDSLAAIERARADSVAAMERMRRDSVARADSIAQAEQLRREQMRNRYLFNGSGWYLGVSGGTSQPSGVFQDLGYDRGFNVTVPIGYHARNHLLGVRMDLAYNQFGGGTFSGTGTGGSLVTLNNGEPKVLSAALNLTARFPLGTRAVALYGVGGGGLYHFRAYGPTSALGTYLGDDVLDNNDEAVERTKNKFGWNVGGGIDFGVGPASLYLESRFVNVLTDRDLNSAQFPGLVPSNRSSNIRWIPITLGVTFR